MTARMPDCPSCDDETVLRYGRLSQQLDTLVDERRCEDCGRTLAIDYVETIA